MQGGGKLRRCEGGVQQRYEVGVQRHREVQERGLEEQGVQERLCGSGISSWRGGNGSKGRSGRRLCGLEVAGMESAEVGSGRSSMPLEERAESRAAVHSSEKATLQVGFVFV